MTLFVMKKQTLWYSTTVDSSFGYSLLQQSSDKKYISLNEGLPVEGKSVSPYFIMERYFDWHIKDEKRCFFRLLVETVGQEDLTIDVIPDWDAVPEVNQGTLKDTIKRFDFVD
jgi:hypothetical protein